MVVLAQAGRKVEVLTGNEAAALAMKQINPDVVAAYPITPATEIVQIFSAFEADGEVDTEFVPVESEHAAMSACIGAAAAGARAMTATSSQGLALMHEVLYIAAGLRLPIVMPEVNRALSAPLNIHCDHSDTMGSRDSGWIQLYAENAQEMYDNLFQAVRIAEHPDILLPVMVTMDGFIISHAQENVELVETEAVRRFIGEYRPRYPLLDTDHPVSIGALDLYDWYFEHRRGQAEAMYQAPRVIEEVGREYGRLTGRTYGLFEPFHLDEAERVIVVLGSTAGTAKYVVTELRARGEKVGLLKLRSFRPFPHAQLVQALAHVKAVAVLDRADSLAAFGGPLFSETRAACYDLEPRPLMVNYIYGLGGRDCDLDQLHKVYADLSAMLAKGKGEPVVQYLGLRE
ncbi:MAG: pyruvate ferredoxin oxidoreductase [Bacillota bacterium]|nr:pyruvate ferredoxin oxidoreductase [Bacillota bacterium]